MRMEIDKVMGFIAIWNLDEPSFITDLADRYNVMGSFDEPESSIFIKYDCAQYSAVTWPSQIVKLSPRIKKVAVFVSTGNITRGRFQKRGLGTPKYLKPRRRAKPKVLVRSQMPWITLHDDLVVHSGRHCTARALLNMSGSCKGWRAALAAAEEALWKGLVLRRFPRMVKILELSNSTPASHRTLYREQLAVDATAPASKPARKTRLSEYIFTVECTAAGETLTWAGTVARVDNHPVTMNGLVVLEDGTCPRLDGTATEGGGRRLRQMLAEDNWWETTVVVYVTHNLKTVKLYREGVDEEYMDDELRYVDDKDQPDALVFAGGPLPRRFGQTELWDDPTIEAAEPVLRVHVAVTGDGVEDEDGVRLDRPGDVGLLFLQDEVNFGNMTTEQLLGYLEEMVPWP